uniref:Uncharacterized protein n=1 Tax=Oncorhynchus tshawytscha TaxID=74940 RepID=A0A8C8IGZ1_ONCTS
MSEQGVQDGTEHPPLRDPCVEDQRGRCVVIYLRKFRIQLQRELFCPMVLRLVISFEGTLAMLGIFLTTHSAVLIEDVPFNEEDIQNPPYIIYDLYNQVGYSCFIAAGIYMLVMQGSFVNVLELILAAVAVLFFSTFLPIVLLSVPNNVCTVFNAVTMLCCHVLMP